jgi:hypothetical protein
MNMHACIIMHGLSAQGRLDPRGGFHCFWCLNKTLNPFASGALKIIKKWIKIEKVMTSQSRGV